MERETRSTRYSFRVHPNVKHRLYELAADLQTTVTDLLIIGALSLAQRANTPAEFYLTKSKYLAETDIVPIAIAKR